MQDQSLHIAYLININNQTQTTNTINLTNNKLTNTLTNNNTNNILTKLTNNNNLQSKNETNTINNDTNFDVLRDEGTAYAAALREAGVDVRHVNEPALPHGFITMTRVCSEATATLDEIAAEIHDMA